MVASSVRHRCCESLGQALCLTGTVLAAICFCRSGFADGALVNLAPLASVTCAPEPDGDSLKAVTDGNPRRGLVFAVLSKGEGTVTLTFPTVQQIEKIRILQGERAYYSTAYRFVADCDGNGDFETTLAEVKERATWGEWSTFDLKPVVVKAIRFQSLAGKSEGARAHPVVEEMEVYGPATRENLQELIRMGNPPTAFPVLKPLFLTTPLVADGNALCAILTPDEPGYRELGERVAAILAKKTGAKPVVRTSIADVDPEKITVIALGQMINNKLIERLYWNHYLYLDSLCPGKDGYLFQTVHNPYPWTGGHNVLVLGGSTIEGVQRAVGDFEALVSEGRNLSLPYTLKVKLPPAGQREAGYVVEGKEYTNVTLPDHDLTEAEARGLLAAEATPSLLAFQELALKYLVTGEEPYLQAGKKVLDVMAKVYDQDPDRHPSWPEETNSRFIFAAWDAVEEAPVFTDEERLRYTNMLLRFLYSLIGQTSDYGNLKENDTIIWNHTTFPLMGLYWGGRYFRRYYDCPYMDLFLKEAAGAFRGQEKSWKPQCDADSYLTLTIGHTIEYALAEGKRYFLESGNLHQYADYLLGICDNRGWAAGFGDSGVFKSTAVPDAGVPYAFWYTRDPRYLWYLHSIHAGRWLNPFHQDVKPEPPADHLGVRVFPLDRQVYDYTKTRPYYGEPSGPPNVPFEQAFDKISFRASFDPMGQYFLLDGYSRGKHLHYDGNAVLKLTDKGEDWLIDGDYLVRNTTEHNMVSVIREGRSEKLVPECAALLHHADLPSHGFTETMMKDYNGVGWSRSIVWQKGGWIVMLDRMVARETGNYKFDCVFKVTDVGGEELVDPHRFRITRGGPSRLGSFGLDKVKLAGDAGNVGVVFAQADSQLQCGVHLKTGRYRVTLFAQGVDTSSDSFWLTIDGEEPVAFHLPTDHLGSSSSAASKTVPTPEVEVKTSGDHTLTLTLREGPGPVLDRLMLEDVAHSDNRVVLKAAEAPPARKRPPDRSRKFYIVNADGATQSVARRVGSSGPMKYLIQRQAVDLKPEGATTFQNLLYLDDIGQEKKYSLQRISDHALLARVERPTLVGTDSFASDGLRVEAAMFCLSEDKVSLVDATAFAVSKPVLKTSAPVSVELDLARSQATIIASQQSEVTLMGHGPIQVEPGKHTLPLRNTTELKRQLKAFLSNVSQQGKTGAQRVKTTAPVASGMSELWRLPEEGNGPEIRDFTTSDLDGDGRPEVLVCRGNELQCYSAEGKIQWKFTAQRRLRCVTACDLDGDGKIEVLCGGEDEQFHVLDEAGREKASHTMIERLVVGQGGTVLPYVNCLVVDDLDGDGSKEIIVGCSNSQISVFDTKLQRRWNRDGIYHGVRKVLAVDLDGDGKKEVLAADHYGSVALLSHDGKSRSSAYSELGDVAFDVGDLNGDGKLEVVNGSSTGTLAAFAYPVNQLFTFNNYGYAARQVLLMDLDGDHKAETLVASDTGYLYALDGTGKPIWQSDLGSAVLCLARGNGGLAGGDFIAVGQRDGQVRVLNLRGETTASFSLPSALKLLKCSDLNGDGRDEIIAVDRENRFAVLR